jgi:(4S)-4-hydroxy-5-phosphonooxypentane-2,3-dione isomerase
MLVNLVHIHVKSEHIDAFVNATEAKARSSQEDPGVARIYVIQQEDDPTHFVLVETYDDEAASVVHKETDHYKGWQTDIAQMVADDLVVQAYKTIYLKD